MERSRICISPRRRLKHGVVALCLGAAGLLAGAPVSAAAVAPALPDKFKRLRLPDDTMQERCPGGVQWREYVLAQLRARGPASSSMREATDPALRQRLLDIVDSGVRSPKIEALAARAVQVGASGGGFVYETDVPDTEGPDVALTPWLKDSLANLREIVERRGFPAPQEVGEEGVQALWELIFTAHSDPDLQIRGAEWILQINKDNPGEMRSVVAAWLIDTALLAQGKGQRYGQLYELASDGSLVRQAVDDEGSLEKRRAKVGLMPASLELCVRRDLHSVDGWMPAF